MSTHIFWTLILKANKLDVPFHSGSLQHPDSMSWMFSAKSFVKMLSRSRLCCKPLDNPRWDKETELRDEGRDLTRVGGIAWGRACLRQGRGSGWSFPSGPASFLEAAFSCPLFSSLLPGVLGVLSLWLRVSILPSHMSLCRSCLWRKSLSLASRWPQEQGSAMTQEPECSLCSDLHFNEGSGLITPRKDPGGEELHILVEAGDEHWGEGEGGQLF